MTIQSPYDTTKSKELVGESQANSTQTFTAEYGFWDPNSYTIYYRIDSSDPWSGVGGNSDLTVDSVDTDKGEFTLTNSQSSVDSWEIGVDYTTDAAGAVIITDFSFLSVDSAASSGSGGGDMDSWSLSGFDKTGNLIQSDFSNDSSYNIRSGVFTYGGYDAVTPAITEKDSEIDHSNVTTTDAESGSEGGDMDSWGLDRAQKLESLCQSDFTNNSSYSIENGMVSYSGYDATNPAIGRGDSETYHLPVDSSGESGEGGGNMLSWAYERKKKMDILVSSQYSNGSSFDLPNGIVDFAGYDSTAPVIGFDDSEMKHGINITGSAFDSERNEISGEAYILDGQDPIFKGNVYGTFVINSPPPGGVQSGTSVSRATLDFRFVPDIDAFDFINESINISNSFDISYGEITGQILDGNGDPVSEHPIAFPRQGVETTTDGDGKFSFQAGAGQLQYQTMYGAVRDSVEIKEFQSQAVDLQFPKVEVEVRLPNGSGIKGVPVFAGSVEREPTDDNGKASFVELPPLTNVEFVIGGVEKETLNTPDQGGTEVIRLETGAGVQGEVYNKDTLNKITDTPIRIATDASVQSKSKGAGEFAVGAFEPGTVRVDVGFNDPRYQTESFVVELDEGEVVRQDVGLSKGFLDSTY